MLLSFRKPKTIARPRKPRTLQTRTYETRSRTMSGNIVSEEENTGRNLSHEIDEIRARVEAMSERQSIVEEMLRILTEALNIKNASGNHTDPGTSVTMNNMEGNVNHAQGSGGVDDPKEDLEWEQPGLTVGEEKSLKIYLSNNIKAEKLSGKNKDFSEKVAPVKRRESDVGYAHQSHPQPKALYQTPSPNFLNYQITPFCSIYHNSHPSTPYHVNNIPPQQAYTSPQPANTYRPPPPRNLPSQGRARPSLDLPPFLKLPISNVDLFQQLYDSRLVAGIPARPMAAPFPAWYNPNVTCKFHMEAPGHSIENCEMFRTAVRRLIAYGKLEVTEEEGPSITNKPILNHEDRTINSLEEDYGNDQVA